MVVIEVTLTLALGKSSLWSKYVWEGYQQQEPNVITQCFMSFKQSLDRYTIPFYLIW